MKISKGFERNCLNPFENMTDETKEKWIEAHKGNKIMLGRKLANETKENQSFNGQAL